MSEQKTHKEALKTVLTPPAVMVGIIVCWLGITSVIEKEQRSRDAREQVLANVTQHVSGNAYYEADGEHFFGVYISEIIYKDCHYLSKERGGLTHMGNCSNPAHLIAEPEPLTSQVKNSIAQIWERINVNARKYSEGK